MEGIFHVDQVEAFDERTDVVQLLGRRALGAFARVAVLAFDRIPQPVGGQVQAHANLDAFLVFDLFLGLFEDFQRAYVVQVGRPRVLVIHSACKAWVVRFEQPAGGAMHLQVDFDGVPHGLGADGHHHVFLHVWSGSQAVGTPADHVAKRRGQGRRIVVAQQFVERDFERVRRGPGNPQRQHGRCIAADALEVRGSVQADQQVINLVLLRGVHADQGGNDFLVQQSDRLR